MASKFSSKYEKAAYCSEKLHAYKPSKVWLLADHTFDGQP